MSFPRGEQIMAQGHRVAWKTTTQRAKWPCSMRYKICCAKGIQERTRGLNAHSPQHNFNLIVARRALTPSSSIFPCVSRRDVMYVEGCAASATIYLQHIVYARTFTLWHTTDHDRRPPIIIHLELGIAGRVAWLVNPSLFTLDGYYPRGVLSSRHIPSGQRDVV